MAHFTKRTRSDILEDDTTWEKPMTMLENLQGSNTSLGSTLNNLSQATNALNKWTPSMQQFSAMAKMNRRYEMVTTQYIEQARLQVASETIPEIDMYLNEAQLLVDQMALEAEHKVNKKRRIESSQQVQDARKKRSELEQRSQAYRTNQLALDKEKEEIDNTLAALELELAQLDQALELKQQTSAPTPPAVEEDEDEDEDEEVDDDEDEKYYTGLVEEEAQLIKELEAIRAQQKQQDQERQQVRRLQEQQQQQQQQQMAEKAKMEIDQGSLKEAMTKETCEQQIAVMTECIDLLRTLSPDEVPTIDIDILRSYKAALEQENSKILPKFDMKTKLSNNRTILKMYCKHILEKKTLGMGFVAQRLVDLVFTDEGYREMSLQQLLEAFEKPRQKDLVKQLVERYPAFTLPP